MHNGVETGRGPVQDIQNYFPELKESEWFEITVVHGELPFIHTSDGRRFVFLNSENEPQTCVDFFNYIKDSVGILNEEVVSVKIRFHKDEVAMIHVDRALLYPDKLIEQLKTFTVEEHTE